LLFSNIKVVRRLARPYNLPQVAGQRRPCELKSIEQLLASWPGAVPKAASCASEKQVCWPL